MLFDTVVKGFWKISPIRFGYIDTFDTLKIPSWSTQQILKCTCHNQNCWAAEVPLKERLITWLSLDFNILYLRIPIKPSDFGG